MDIISKFKPIGHQELVAYIFSFLDFDYNIYVILNERKKKGRSLTILTYPLSEYFFKDKPDDSNEIGFISRSI
ncbi:MAG: hypothetical protein QLV_08 [Qinghai Lake virophage]|jgi:hypothetical protein|uniref:Uncharacterized protein n=1 Tax=Qinghai Lake virophage TaxID=1516115 RepID=A0A0R5K4S6_9VIRU|nr:MAG: hypothetical protein QLV_08 [Qinghai Lake virophage]